MSSRRHAVILAGGVGERFWPLSRRDRPKQFLPLADGTSLLRATFERLLGLVPAENIRVVTNAEQARLVRRELPELPPRRILKEPVGRNTAPAVALGTYDIARTDPGASVVVVPSDAWVPRAGAYRAALRTALRAAERTDSLVLVGVRPTRPETGYGYILPGEPLGVGSALRVKRFEEKPKPAKAKRFLAGGKHLWNCGVFAWRAEVLATAVENHLPELARAFAPFRSGPLLPKTLGQAYRRAPSISVDYGLLERAANVAVVPGEFPWDDLGSWGALERLGRGDGFSHGDVVALDSPGSVVWADSGAVGLVGVQDVVVVHTPDATLVVAKDRAQDVRALVDRLARSERGRRYLRMPRGKKP